MAVEVELAAVITEVVIPLPLVAVAAAAAVAAVVPAVPSAITPGARLFGANAAIFL